jgi:hypothetical protein
MHAPRIGIRPVEPGLEAVLEKTSSLRQIFWLRQADGGFTPMRRGKFCSQVKVKEAGKNAEEFLSRALNNRVKILITAGLQAGVYAGPKGHFLVPQFTPLAAPLETEDPPAEFQSLSQELLGVMNGAGEANRREQLRNRMVEIYKEVRGVEACKEPRNPWRLLGVKDSPSAAPNDERAAMFTGAQGFIRTCQSHGYDVPDVVGFARFHRLSVTVSPKWTWYFPGRTVLIEWRKA